MARKRRNLFSVIEEPGTGGNTPVVEDPGSAGSPYPGEENPPASGGDANPAPVDSATPPPAQQPAPEQGNQTSAGQGNPTVAPSSGPRTYNTPKGPRTIDQMRSELAGAGYNGPTDDASLVAAYNRTVSGSGRSAGGVGNFSDFDSAYQKLIDAAAQGNQAKFDEAKREFDLEYALKKQQFEASQREAYAARATDLLRLQAGLSGPADYMQYFKNLAGGQELNQILRGNQSVAAYGAPAGFTAPLDLATLMQQLGLSQPGVPVGPAPAAGRGDNNGGIPSSQNGTIPANGTPTIGTSPAAQPDIIRQLFGGQGSSPLAVAAQKLGVNAPVDAFGGPVTPAPAVTGTPGVPGTMPMATAGSGAGLRLLSAANPTGAVTPQGNIGIMPVPPEPPTADAAAPVSIHQQMDDWQKQFNQAAGRYPSGPEWWTKFRSITGASDAQARQANTEFINRPGGFDSWVKTNVPPQPLPHQVNPAVWDSLGPAGQKLALSIAAGGYTEAGAYTPEDYLRLINAARPQGRVGRDTNYDYQSPAGAF